MEKLVIFERKCAHGECNECGIEKFVTAHKYPQESDEGLQINIKEYQDLERNYSDKKQKELCGLARIWALGAGQLGAGARERKLGELLLSKQCG